MDTDSSSSPEIREESTVNEHSINYTGLLPVLLLFVVVIARITYELVKSNRQKTRNPQQRRMYVGSRARPSLSQAEPTIYVSPANLPPPPKYEAMAPPSYEDVVGIHYPNYQATRIQPITYPITTAIADNAARNATDNVRTNEPATVITVTSEQRRTSVSVATA